MSGLLQGRPDLIQMGLVGDLHGDHPYAILARQLEHVGQTRLAMPLKRVRIGARLVGPHPRAGETVVLEGLHHGLHMLTGVHGAQAGEDLKGVLTETDAVVVEVGGAWVIGMAPEDSILLGDPHYPLYAGQ